MFHYNVTSSQCECLLLLLRGTIHGDPALLPEVAGEADEVDILLDVVHDLGLCWWRGGQIVAYSPQLLR